MGELKKYDGGIMFGDNDVCDVESLKVRFTPIQSGTGTPSPTNVMPISGYNRFNVKHTGKNVCRLDGWGAKNTNNYGDAGTTNSYGTTISTADPSEPVVITQSQAPDSSSINTYQNGYFVIVSDSLEFDKYYNVSFDVTNITNNPLNIAINSIALVSPSGGSFSCSLVNENRIMFKNYQHKQKSSSPTLKINQIEVRICGLSCTISNVLITKVVDENADYEAFNGKEFVIDSPVSGKNLCDIYGIGATNFMSIYAEPSDTNSYGTSIVVSENNNKVVITQSQAPNTSQPWYYQNGYISLGVLGLTFEKTYKVSFRVTNIVNNPLNTTLSDIKVYPPSGSGGAYNATIYDTDRVLFTIPYNMFQSKPYRNYFEIRNCGMSCTLSDFMVTEADVEDQTYEPYKKTMYGGYIDFVKGEYVQEWACETDNGGTWYLTQEGNAYQWGHSKCSNAVADIISTHWKTTKVNTNENKVFMNPNGALYIGREFWNAADITPTAESVAAYFQTQKEAGTPLYCCCKLLNPIHHPLTPLQLQTYAGINNIWCEANGEADIWYRNSKPISTEVEKSVTGDTYGIANFETKSALPLEKCKVGFEFSQDLNGYSKPWAGGAGKNLYDAEKYPLTDGKWINTIQGESTSDTPYSCTLDYIPCDKLQGKTLTLNKRPGGTNPGVAFYSTKGVSGFISGVKNNDATPNTPMTFEVPSTANYMRFTVPSGATDIQIEIGDTATSYEPYANICPINGTSEFNVVHTGKNLAHIVGYSASSIQRPYSARYLSNSYGTTINTIDYLGKDGAVVITQSQAPKDSYPSSYQNGYFEVIPDNLVFGKSYCVSFKISEIISNPLNVDLSSIKIGAPSGSVIGGSVDTNENKMRFNIDYRQSTNKPNMTDISIYNCGMSFTLSEFMVTPLEDADTTFEPYRSETIPVKLPALGKNLLNPNFTDWKNGGINYRYFKFTNNPVNHTISFNSKDSSVDLSGIYLGFSKYPPKTVDAINSGYSWIIENGVLNSKRTNKLTYPSSETNTYGTFVVIMPQTEEAFNKVFSKYYLQIEEGSEYTRFEPYNNTVYSGYLDMSNGELTLDWIGKTDRLLNANDVNLNTATFSFYNILPPTIRGQSYCSIAPYLYKWTEERSVHYYMGVDTGQTNSTLRIVSPNTINPDIEFTIVGKLQSPITYQLTPQQITAFRGMNNIYQTASNSIEINYKDMNHNELDLIGLRRSVLLNAPHMETINS